MVVIKIRIKPLNNSTRNNYDSILKIATHAFTNALIPIIKLPEDEYEVISCEIFSPGNDVKSMDILLKGKNGYVNIEFHKQPLSKSHLDRDFEYVVQYYLFYGETIEQKIVVVDNNRKSIEKINVTPDYPYYGNYYYVPDIDGCEVLNSIKYKLMSNQEPSEYEQYVFSILPLTNHHFRDEEQLMKELCSITPKLNIPEKNRDAINLCHMILVELFVSDDLVKEELYDVITMTMTYIEKRENKFKHDVKTANERVATLEKELNDTNKKLDEKDKALDEKDKALGEKDNLLKEIVDNIDGERKLNMNTMKKLLSVTSKL